jgi:hypothetical protein
MGGKYEWCFRNPHGYLHPATCGSSQMAEVVSARCHQCLCTPLLLYGDVEGLHDWRGERTEGF